MRADPEGANILAPAPAGCMFETLIEPLNSDFDEIAGRAGLPLGEGGRDASGGQKRRDNDVVHVPLHRMSGGSANSQATALRYNLSRDSGAIMDSAAE
jgi:hypothetical protein